MTGPFGLAVDAARSARPRQKGVYVGTEPHSVPVLRVRRATARADWADLLVTRSRGGPAKTH